MSLFNKTAHIHLNKGMLQLTIPQDYMCMRIPENPPAWFIFCSLLTIKELGFLVNCLRAVWMCSQITFYAFRQYDTMHTSSIPCICILILPNGSPCFLLLLSSLLATGKPITWIIFINKYVLNNCIYNLLNNLLNE